MSFRDSPSAFCAHKKQLSAMLKHLLFPREGKSDIQDLNHMNSEFQRNFSLGLKKKQEFTRKKLMLYSCLVIKSVELNQAFHSQKRLFTKNTKRKAK